MDKKRFEEIRDAAVSSGREGRSIGTYKEKTLHAILKDYYAPDKSMQEISVDGYVADIYTGQEIIEIQTAIKYLSWIDEATGECSKPRKSPVKGSVYRAFVELYKIKSILSQENLCLCFPLLEVEEYRLLNGWSQDKKKGSCRYDRIPRALLDEIRLEKPEDYLRLIPENLPEPFTALEFGKAVGEKKQIAGIVLHVLNYLNVLERCENRGRFYTYRRAL